MVQASLLARNLTTGPSEGFCLAAKQNSINSGCQQQQQTKHPPVSMSSAEGRKRLKPEDT
jgi:hypothetical protein